MCKGACLTCPAHRGQAAWVPGLPRERGLPVASQATPSQGREGRAFLLLLDWVLLSPWLGQGGLFLLPTRPRLWMLSPSAPREGVSVEPGVGP